MSVLAGDSLNRPGRRTVRYRERYFPYIQLKRPLDGKNVSIHRLGRGFAVLLNKRGEEKLINQKRKTLVERNSSSLVVCMSPKPATRSWYSLSAGSVPRAVASALHFEPRSLPLSILIRTLTSVHRTY